MKKFTLFFVASLFLLINLANTQTFTKYTESTTTLINNKVFAISIDAEDNKWFGTNGGGVSKLTDGTTGITPIINENHFNLYPNPVQNVLHINLSGKTAVLQAFDISEKCLLQKQITEDNTSLDVSCLENGIYVVRVMCDNKIFAGEFVKY